MKRFSSLLILLALIILPQITIAQPPDPGGGGDNKPGCFPPPCVPIDGGLSWLLLAGAVYGGKKVYDTNNFEEEID